MSGEIYNKSYYDEYDTAEGKVNYKDAASLKDFLASVADRIVSDLHPRTVLDAGCAMGHLVAALRDRGIEAYGIDISEYAISQVREDIRPFCAVCSLTEQIPDSFPGHFDLVTNIEVIEHLYAVDGKKAVRNLAALTDQILFSSTPDDFEDPTHLNVQQREYWARIFAECGFYDNLLYRPLYLSEYAVLYKKLDDPLQAVEDYERFVRQSEDQNKQQRNDLDAANDQLSQLLARQKAEEQYTATVCFDTGGGFSEDNKTELSYDQRHIFDFKLSVPDHCKSVRFEPVKGRYCLIQNLEVTCDDGFLPYDNTYSQSWESMEFFRTSDPLIEILIPASITWIRIRAEIHLFEDPIMTAIPRLAKSFKEASERAAEFTAENDVLAKKNAVAEQTVQEQQIRAAELQAKLTAQEEETYRQQKLAGEMENKLKSCEEKLSDQLEKTRETEKELNANRKALQLTEEELNKLKEQNSHIDEELAHYKLHYNAAINQREELKKRVSGLEQELNRANRDFSEITNAFFWKITKPARFTLIILKWLFLPHSGDHLLRKGLYSLRTRGVSVTRHKAMEKIYSDMSKKPVIRPEPFTEQELIEQQKHQFPHKIKFSLVVPLYNTPKTMLRAMIDSVFAQTYPNWELCMTDGSDAGHSDVKRICRKYAKHDSRIRYRKLEKNLGISGNTNACLEMAAGDYIGLLDHDDLLHPAALYEVMRAICEKGADFIYTDEMTFYDTPGKADLPHFKPGFAPDTLRTNNYICHFTAFKRSLLEEVGFFDPDCDGSQDHDMVLRLTEKAERIAHIPEILYYWRAHKGSVADNVGVKPYVTEAGVRAVEKQLARLGLEGTVEPVRPGLTIYRTRYKINSMPRISILIPNYEHLDCLKTCLDSVFSKTTWPNYEIVIVENNSRSPEVFAYYDEIQKTRKNVRVVTWQGQFNYSAINNFGAQYCTGDYLLLLNNDVEVITPGWIEEMLMFAQRPDVGAVGAILYYPDNTIQHAGVGIGIRGVAGHYFNRFARNDPGYMGRLLYAQDMSAVTGACMMLRRDVWENIQGLDEEWAVAFNDIDLCLRIRQAGYLIVWTPFAELYHGESVSRGYDDTQEKQERFHLEVFNFQKRWKDILTAGDPYFSPNFSLDRGDFSVADVLEQHDAR